MRTLARLRVTLFCLFSTLFATVGPLRTPAGAAELLRITPENYDDVVPKGKEVDAILGDYLLRNNDIVAVIAQPVPGRKANMTVRGVGGMLIDFTRRYHGSDQLSCFYPAAGRYLFEDPQQMTCEVDGQTVTLQDAAAGGQTKRLGKTISLTFVGTPVADDGTWARVTWTLADNQAWLDYRVELKNESATDVDLPVQDSLRCDGNLFQTGVEKSPNFFFANDSYFGQCYGIVFDNSDIQQSGSGRNLRLEPVAAEATASPKTAAAASSVWSGKVYCSQGLPGVRSWAAGLATNTPTRPMQLKLQSPQGAIAHARVEIRRQGESLGAIESDASGMVRTELLPGNYTAVIESIGRPERSHEFVIENSLRADSLSLPAASRVRARVVDGEDRPIAAKVQFRGIEGTADPDFGPDSAVDAIKNIVYCAQGKFEQPIPPGRYEAIISHGPEYDAERKELSVGDGQLVLLESKLPRTVQTNGWVSADFHSHSSPSGDNVSAQRGRVLNLLAEHIEFAPCTEHNRIDTYEDDLLALGATSAMATCTGMELTGSPLPINHQNAFPLHRHPHEQDGGGPDTDADPEKQIERLALWDDNSSKVLQTNHPNIPQILGDKDLDGQPDAGFQRMLGFMDAIEVHPPEGIFTPPPATVSPKDKYENPIFFWMRLLNLGHRITGVVNTDAHYNFHGSGWLRNYLESSTDEPTEIDIAEMIHASEHGHLVMTTGPFLSVQLRTGSDESMRTHISGEDVDLSQEAEAASAKLWISVQCPNWFDVNRVQVFANGRPLDVMNYTRKTHPQFFSDNSVRFALLTDLPKFEEDTHLIVATIGEGLELGPVMGEERGKLPPVAVANPIFLDVDGGGFKPNGDDLGVPFMLVEGK